jgi:hypothetical protein
MEKCLRRVTIGCAIAAALSTTALADDTCNGLIHIDYVGAPAVSNIGDTLDVKITFGTGSIQGGTKLTLTSFQLNLDCNSDFALSPPCVDEGAVIEYEGDASLSTDCPGVAFGSNVPGGGSAPNVISFTATPALDIPADQPTLPGFCSVSFKVKVLAPSSDGTPEAIEELAGYDIAACDNGVLLSGGFQTSAIGVPPPTTTTTTTTSTTTIETTTTTTTTSTTTTSTTTTTTSTTTTTTVALFTRTPGFWKNRPEITLLVITNAGGLTVCGQPIINVAIDDARSAIEAMCVKIEGIQRRQLARQLMAASLNVAAGGAPFPQLAACNAICANPASPDAAVTGCINDADAYNNSGDKIGLPFDPGSANSKPCKLAQNTDCVIIDPPTCAAP